MRAVTAALAVAMDVPVRSSDELTPDEIQRCQSALSEAESSPATLTQGALQYIAARVDGLEGQFLLLGPYRRAGEAESAARLLSDSEIRRAHAALMAAAAGLRSVADQPRRLLDSSRQLEILSSAIIAISGELQLDAVLRTITDLARTFASARYAALGVPNAEGMLETFVTAGLSADEEARIGHRPQGLGLLGTLLRDRQHLRLDDLSSHPDSVGFPDNHPMMRSFLGMPIVARSGEIIGSLYLAEKRAAVGFSVDDEMLIELLARHAAVAIENARLYRQLEENERRLGQILDQLPEAVMLLEPGPDRIVVMNQQARRLLGVDLPLPIPMEMLDALCGFVNVREEPIGVAETPFQRTLRTGVTVEREELTVSTETGGQHTLLVNSAPVRLDEIVNSYICVFQDITEIRDADRLKDDFLSLVSHELRTPLTTIHGGAQLLLKEADSLDRALRDELLADMHQESARLAALIQNLVELTHMRAGRVGFEPEPVLLRALVARCVSQLAPLAPDREFRVDIGPDVVALADADRVDEMLRNVLHNALKYTPDGTPIDVAARDTGDAVEFSVRDYGPGIPAREIARVFERFERGSKAASATSGMGLGLYLARLLVEAQGGAVHVEAPEDGGARFVFRLPRASADV